MDNETRLAGSGQRSRLECAEDAMRRAAMLGVDAIYGNPGSATRRQYEKRRAGKPAFSGDPLADPAKCAEFGLPRRVK